MAKAAEVKQRIERILDDTRQIPQALTRARWTGLVVCAVPVVYLAAVLQPVPAAAQSAPRTPAEINEFLKGKRQYSASDVSVMEQYLAANPHDLDLRSQLVLYYFGHDMPAERNAHIMWLVVNHPESEAALITSLGISPRPGALNTRADYDRIAGLWQQQAAAHPTDWRVLDHAGQFFSQSGADYNKAEQLLLDIKKIEPVGHNWDEKLGRVYAKAILGATGDPSFPNSAPDMAARLKTQLETSMDGFVIFYTANALRVARRPAAGEPLSSGMLNLDDHALLLPAIDLAERLSQRAAELGVRPGGGRTVSFNGSSGVLTATVNQPAGTIGTAVTSDLNIRREKAIQQANLQAALLPPAPAPLKRVEPEYPPLARQARIEGTVKLAVRIDASGSTEEISAISGHPLLVPAALEAVRQWAFSAGTGGKYLLEVNFSLPPGSFPPRAFDDATPRKGGAVLAPGRIRVGGNVQASQLTHKVDPAYPALARTAGIEGNVALRVIINEDGTVLTADPVDGHPLLMAAAIEAVRQWTYRPTFMNGSPVQVETTVTIPFDLNR